MIYKFFIKRNWRGVICRLWAHGVAGIVIDGGNLNPHMDFSIHPKIKLERFLNIIICESDIKEAHGEHLGLWEHDSKNIPKALKFFLV